jgi:hypothetical protein
LASDELTLTDRERQAEGMNWSCEQKREQHGQQCHEQRVANTAKQGATGHNESSARVMNSSYASALARGLALACPAICPKNGR